MGLLNYNILILIWHARKDSLQCLDRSLPVPRSVSPIHISYYFSSPLILVRRVRVVTCDVSWTTFLPNSFWYKSCWSECISYIPFLQFLHFKTFFYQLEHKWLICNPWITTMEWPRVLCFQTLKNCLLGATLLATWIMNLRRCFSDSSWLHL